MRDAESAEIRYATAEARAKFESEQSEARYKLDQEYEQLKREAAQAKAEYERKGRELREKLEAEAAAMQVLHAAIARSCNATVQPPACSFQVHLVWFFGANIISLRSSPSQKDACTHTFHSSFPSNPVDFHAHVQAATRDARGRTESEVSEMRARYERESADLQRQATEIKALYDRDAATLRDLLEQEAAALRQVRLSSEFGPCCRDLKAPMHP